MPERPPYRLPRAVLPRRYRLDIELDERGGSYEGRVRVDVEVLERTDRVVLNAVGLEVHAATVAAGGAGGAGVPVAGRLRPVPEEEQVVLELPGPLAPGPAVLDVRFGGPLGEEMRGFYRSRFTGPDGAEGVILATDFEATNARRAFPCFDEPDMKAVFVLTLTVPEGVACLSSAPAVADEAVGRGRRRVRFAETIPLPTYVVAWVVGPLDLTEAVDVDGVAVRVAAPAGQLPFTGYAVRAATHALRYLADYFGIPYPGAKLDHVAIPNFASGAMENLGCVTYRESLLLADPGRASQPELREIALTIAHETSHMWFGDLATMRWWNGLWLNEAFATFMETKATEAFNPDWDVWTATGPGRAQALLVDGLASTRPVEYRVERPEDAEGMFDVLTYDKGGAVLRMLEQHLGEDTFRRGIARYLERHAYGNAETTDLWDALEAESGQPVRVTMDGWILQSGYPVVAARRGARAGEVVLEATQFCYRGDGPGHWRVPLLVRASVAGRVEHRRVLLDGQRTERFDGPVDWVVANGGGWGFCRVDTEDGLAPRGEALRGCTPLERLALLDDAWAAAMAGRAGVERFVGMAADLGEETQPEVWGVVSGPLLLLDRITPSAQRRRLADAVAVVAGPAWRRLGWELVTGEPLGHRQARARLVTLLGVVAADAGVRAEAARRWADHRSGRRPVEADLLSAVLHVVAAGGGHDEFDQVWEAYLDAGTPQDRERFLMVLPRFRQADLAGRCLQLALSPEVRSQDTPFVVHGVLAGWHGHDVGWPWWEANADECARRLTPQLLGRALEGAALLADGPTVQRAHRWLASHPLPTSPDWIARVEERMDLTVAMADRLGGDLGPLPVAA